MQEIEPQLVGDSSLIGNFCKKMYHMVERDNPITGNFNGVRIIMFIDDKEHQEHKEGKFDPLSESSIEQWKRNEP
jgi:hypothetical protein